MKIYPCEGKQEPKERLLTWDEMLKEGEGVYRDHNDAKPRFIVLVDPASQKRVVLWKLGDSLEPADLAWPNAGSIFIKTDEKLYLSIK